MNKDYTCYVISNKPQLFSGIQASIQPTEINFFNGKGYTSFSKLVNSCVASCPTETIILMSDKVTPDSNHIQKTLTLIEEGYGLVGLYRLAFFGFKKELFRKIGPFDERFVGGGYEDDDFYIRLKEANISAYLTEEIPYKKSASSWNYSLSRPHFVNKWLPNVDVNIKLHHNKTERRLAEEVYSYTWGNTTATGFLPWDKSYIATSKAKKYTGDHV
jgi:GT2 family glycosyltransferase